MGRPTVDQETIQKIAEAIYNKQDFELLFPNQAAIVMNDEELLNALKEKVHQLEEKNNS